MKELDSRVGYGVLMHEIGEAYSRTRYGEDNPDYERDHFGLAYDFELDTLKDYKLTREVTSETQTWRYTEADGSSFNVKTNFNRAGRIDHFYKAR